MEIDFINNNISLITGIAAIIGILISIYKYMDKRYKNNILRTNELKIKDLFESTVSKLSSNNSSEKISSAILLRRFLDKDSELGVGGTPLAKETINVIAAMLRVEKTGDFQKLLADSLKYATTLKDSDLQRANLRNAVLGKKNLNFENTDFYQADLSNASFKYEAGKGVNLANSVFYQANLQGTNFEGSNLDGTNFYQANLEGAKFKDAKNIPDDIQKNLVDNIYVQTKNKVDNKIFISKPRMMNVDQEMKYNYIMQKIKDQDMIPQIFERENDFGFGILSRLESEISQCHGMIIFAFKQYKINDAEFRWWNKDESKKIVNDFFPTPWIYVEAGMAIASKLPLFVVSDYNINDSIFESGFDEPLIIKENLDGDFCASKSDEQFNKWIKKLL